VCMPVLYYRPPFNQFSVHVLVSLCIITHKLTHSLTHRQADAYSRPSGRVWPKFGISVSALTCVKVESVEHRAETYIGRKALCSCFPIMSQGRLVSRQPIGSWDTEDPLYHWS
jgi:hypothetical protein